MKTTYTLTADDFPIRTNVNAKLLNISHACGGQLGYGGPEHSGYYLTLDPQQFDRFQRSDFCPPHLKQTPPAPLTYANVKAQNEANAAALKASAQPKEGKGRQTIKLSGEMRELKTRPARPDELSGSGFITDEVREPGRPELSFDGVGINGPDEYRTRLFTSAIRLNPPAGYTEAKWRDTLTRYGKLFEASPEMLKTLQIVLPWLMDAAAGDKVAKDTWKALISRIQRSILSASLP